MYCATHRTITLCLVCGASLSICLYMQYVRAEIEVLHLAVLGVYSSMIVSRLLKGQHSFPLDDARSVHDPSGGVVKTHFLVKHNLAGLGNKPAYHSVPTLVVVGMPSFDVQRLRHALPSLVPPLQLSLAITRLSAPYYVIHTAPTLISKVELSHHRPVHRLLYSAMKTI